VPHIATGIGAVATQALVNPYYGIDGLKLLREGRKPRDIVETLMLATAAATAGNCTSWTPAAVSAAHYRAANASAGAGISRATVFQLPGNTCSPAGACWYDNRKNLRRERKLPVIRNG